MTEKKPGEPDDEDEVFAESLIATYGCAVSNPVDSKVRRGGHPGEETSRLFVEAVVAYRDRIAAQAKREGAREALERAGYRNVGNGPQCRVCWQFESDRPSHTVDCWLAKAIRALADQPEAEGK